MASPARRLLGFLLAKLDDEPLRARAGLCEDLAAFMPDEALARRLLAEARILRQADRRARMLRLVIHARTRAASAGHD